jgi:hypothetical protein
MTGLNGSGLCWCFSGSTGAATKSAGSSGVTGTKEDGKLTPPVGSLGESSGWVRSLEFASGPLRDPLGGRDIMCRCGGWVSRSDRRGAARREQRPTFIKCCVCGGRRGIQSLCTHSCKLQALWPTSH